MRVRNSFFGLALFIAMSMRHAASRTASTAMKTVYASPFVTGMSRRRAMVSPASPTTEVYAPRRHRAAVPGHNLQQRLPRARGRGR